MNEDNYITQKLRFLHPPPLKEASLLTQEFEK